MITPSISYRHIIRIILLLQLAVAALLAAGCHDNSRDALTLDRAEALMEEHPDSALSILQSIDSLHLNKGNTARLAFLKTQARHKLFLAIPQDSTINIAVNYYTTHGPDSMLMKSLFYRAAACKDRGNNEKAIKDATYAWDVANALENIYWKAKSAELIADIFSASLNITEEDRWRTICAEYYRLADKTENHLYSLCDRILSLSNMGENQKAIALIDSLYPIISATNNIALKQFYYDYAAPVLGYYGNSQQADEFMDSLRYFNDGNMDINALCSQAHLSLRKCEYEDAFNILYRHSQITLDAHDSLLLMNELALICHGMGDDKNAYAYADSTMHGQMKMFNASMAQKIAVAQREYYHTKFIDNSRKIGYQKSWIAIIISASCLLLIGGGLLAWWFSRRSLQKFNQKCDEITSMRNHMMLQENLRARLSEALADKSEQLVKEHSDLDKSNARISELNNLLELQINSQAILYKQKWETLNMLCGEFNELKDNETDRKACMANIRRYMESLKDTSFLKEIEKTVNSYMKDVITRLRKQCSSLSEKDILFLTLLYAGLNAKSIAFFMNIKTKYFYNKKDRLLQKIVMSDARDKDEFAELIRNF